MTRWIRNLRIRTKLSLLVVLFAIGLAAFGVFAYRTLAIVEVNGPYYQRIIQGKDLIADVLPPPEYIIESYFVVLRLLDESDPAEVEALVSRSHALRKEYEQRHEFWLNDLPEGVIKAAMVVDSYEPAARFYSIRDAEFLPAVLAGDRDKARAVASGPLREHFQEHRKAIDRVVEMATQRNAAEEKEAMAVIHRSTIGLVALGLTVLAVVVLLSLAIARAIARPLTATVEVLRDIAEGEGDLTRQIEVSSADEIGELGRWFNVFIRKVHDIVAQVQLTAAGVAKAAQQVSAGAEQLASGAQEQASSLEETAASLEQMTGSVKQNADNAQQASQLAVSSRDIADRGGEVVTGAVTAMAEINESSKRIADIITAIDEIAFQTNLLALNAAVEAARAGEQGRGFAVVAAEVRNLAQRSAEAAKEIKGLIQDSVRKVDGGSELVNRSGQTLHEIVTAVKRVTDIVGEIAAASQEQSTGIEQVNQAVSQMDQVTQATAAQTEELSSTAQSMATQARHLQSLVGRFRVLHGVGEHLPQVADAPLHASGGTLHSSESPVPSLPISSTMGAAARSGRFAVANGGLPGNGHLADVEAGFEEF